jgi:hypothetical protein
MFDRYERPLRIICLVLAGVLAWQLGSLFLSRDPLANLKIPALPTLPDATNEPAKRDQKDTNAAIAANTGTNGTSATNVVKGTNMVHSTNAMAKTTNTPTSGETIPTNPPVAGLPISKLAKPAREVMAQMMAGGMPGGRQGGGMKKIDLPPEVQTRVDKIINSEIFGPIIRPVPMALIGIADTEAFIQATNGQTGPVKVGGEMGGIKLLRIGINRVLVEQGGEKKELTIFDGIGGQSLMPKPANEPSTNIASTNASPTNAPSTNAPTKEASKRNAPANNASTNQTLSSKQKETP